jgi:hypothetical protein
MQMRILFFAAVLSAVPVGVVSAQQAETIEARNARVDAEITDVASFVKWAKAAREEKIQRLYQRREAIRAEKGNARFKRKRIEATNDEITRINTPAEPYMPQLASGKVITLENLSPAQYVEVLQIVDDKTAHVRYVEKWSGGNTLEFFLIGIDTAGWVDGQKLALKGVLIADGSKSYTTTSGEKRTIATMKNHPIPKDELTRRDDVRTWTLDGGGQHSGALVHYDAGKVTIMDMNGKQSNLKFTELSPADRDYVSQHAPTPAPRKSSKAPTVAPDTVK